MVFLILFLYQHRFFRICSLQLFQKPLKGCFQWHFSSTVDWLIKSVLFLKTHCSFLLSFHLRLSMILCCSELLTNWASVPFWSMVLLTKSMTEYGKAKSKWLARISLTFSWLWLVLGITITVFAFYMHNLQKKGKSIYIAMDSRNRGREVSSHWTIGPVPMKCLSWKIFIS